MVQNASQLVDPGELRMMPGVQLDYVGDLPILDQPSLQRGRHDPVPLADHVAAGDAVELTVEGDGPSEGLQGLGPGPPDCPIHHLGRAVVVRRLAGRLRDGPDRGVARDHDRRLHQIVGGLRKRRQVGQALTVAGQEGSHVDEALDAVRSLGSRLGDHDAAHAVGDQDRGLVARVQQIADPLRVGVQRHLLHGGRVVAGSRQVRCLGGVTELVQPLRQRSPDPAGDEGPMDQHESHAGTS
jgi:hypothetical protein